MHIQNIHMSGSKKSDGDNTDDIICQKSETVNKCPHCTFIGNNEAIESHIIRAHGNTVICGECGNTFPDTGTCKEHIEAQHRNSPSVEPFPCDECELVLGNFNLHQKHKLKYHVSKQETFHCNECHSTFLDFPSLQKHTGFTSRVQVWKSIFQGL